MSGIPWDYLLGLLSFALTLMVLSYLIGDNLAFRVAVYLFVGVSAGYAAAVAFRQVLLPKLALPLVYGRWDDRVLAGIALVLGVILLMKLSSRTAWLGSISLAFMTGVGAAVAIGGAVVGTLLPQTQASITAFDLSGSTSALRVVGEAAVMLIGTVTTLVYFHFGAKPSAGGPVRGKLVQLLGWVGQFFISGTLGVLFAGVFTAALTALIRLWSLMGSYLNR